MIRLAAFAYAELAEASATLQSLGESRSERARRAYLETVRASIAASSGRELTSWGDGVLAVFESATDAVAFARCLQRGCERESRRSAERLDVRVGIEVGEETSEQSSDVVAGGPAARAQQLARAAEAGKVLASSVVAVLATGADASFLPAGLLELPGAAGPVAAVEVVWEDAGAEQVPLPPELDARASRSPFVGRAAERERLREVWRRALAGDRQLAFVAGEPGIGKTRLVAEFARGLHEEGATVLWGRSFEEALAPYQPFVQALQHHVRFSSAEQLREQVGASAAVLARLLPELATRIAISVAPAEDPESERLRLFEGVGHLLAAASADRPLLLVLDDLQWADQGTLLLLKHLALDPAPAPLLLLGTYRHSEVGKDHALTLMQADVVRDKPPERLDLAGLGQPEVGVLVGSLVGWKPPEKVVRSLFGETEGNPLFLEEVVRHLGELGLTADSQRLARLHATVEELGVPARVRELVGRRVQRLSRAACDAVTSAAVIGSEFGSDVLAEVLGASGPPALVDPLDEAVEARLLVESADRVGRYSFSHALIQQALYETQSLNHRAALHERTAAALEKLQPGARGLDAELAYHYARAGHRHAAKVVRHGRAAGEHALGLFAYEDAVRNLSAALAALDSLDAPEPRERAELLALLGKANTRAGDHPAARDSYHEAAELAAAAGAWPLLALAALGYGAGAGFGGVWESFAKVDEELVRLLELALERCPPGDSHERVRLLGRLAQALYWAPDPQRALALSQESVEIARRLEDPAALGYALDSRHVVLWGPDHLEERRALAEEMLGLGRRARDPDIQLEALAWLITDALETDPIEVVDAYIAEHARIATELRQPYHLWYTEATRAMRAHLDGRSAEAAELCEKAYSYGRQSHGENALQTYLVQTLFVKFDVGTVDTLVPGLREYVASSRLPAWHSALGLALMGAGLREEALAEVEWFARDGFGTIRRDCVWMTTVTILGRIVACFDEPSHAAELYEMLLPFADRVSVVGGAVLCLGPMTWVLGELARTAGRPEEAVAHLERALERSRALGSAPLVARTLVDAARARLLRAATDDAGAAERLLAEASVVAAPLGMTGLEGEIAKLRDSIPQEAVR